MAGQHQLTRTKAAEYAKQFLAQKYYEEYQELYRAYLVNRGINVRTQSNLIDERLLVKND